MRSSQILPLVAIVLLGASGTATHSCAAVGDAGNEVIVEFNIEVGINPHTADLVPLNELRGLPADLQRILEVGNVESVRAGFPHALAAASTAPDPDDWKSIADGLRRVVVLRMSPSGRREGLLRALKERKEIAYAELNHCVEPMGTSNDVLFPQQWNLQNLGRPLSNLYNVGADIHAWSAWDLHKGVESEQVAIIGEAGDVNPHPEFGSRLVGMTGSDAHATQVAGIAGATGDNLDGIAGVNWRCMIRSAGGSSADAIADQIYASVIAGARVLNNSWNQSDPSWSITVAKAIVFAYNSGAVIVCGMPEEQHTGEFPSNYFDGRLTLNVGACQALNYASPSQLSNTWADVAAPGGNHIFGVQIPTTDGSSSYGYVDGTSYAVPHVAGAASLLRSYGQATLGFALSPEDIEEVLERTALDIDASGFDGKTGFGRIDVRRAFDQLVSPHGLLHGTASGGDAVGSWADYQHMWFHGVLGLDGLDYLWAKQYRVERTVTLTYPGSEGDIALWTRGSASLGYDGASPSHYDNHYCYIVPGSWTGNQVTLRTFVYHVRSGGPGGDPVGWFPADPANVVYAWTTFRYAPRSSQSISPTASYYVPQADSSGTVVEGYSAIKLFRACPNNDGGTSLPSNARLKIVLRDSGGAPVAGVSPADLGVLLNGGTAAQGFLGAGADSVIANNQWNRTPQCPDVRMITADAPTDANGVAFITFTGATPGNPGVGTRDSSRKWGHYDTKLPVYVFGMELQGRLTSNEVNGSYQLRIKNFDVSGGLAAVLNQGEAVTTLDLNTVVANINNPGITAYWCDFNNSGSVTTLDYNMLVSHLNHNCAAPENP